jgi:hypothetical protein
MSRNLYGMAIGSPLRYNLGSFTDRDNRGS